MAILLPNDADLLRLWSTHLTRMALAVKQYESLDPMGVSLLGAITVVLDAAPFTDLIQKVG